MRITGEPPLDPSAYPFTYRLRPRFAETDAMGIVHHSQYLVYCEAARVDFMRSLDRPYDRQRDVDGVDFAVVESFVQYRWPLRFDELVDVALRVAGGSRGTFTMEYRLAVPDPGAAGPELRALATTVHAATRADGRPVRLPAWIRQMAAAAE